MVWTCIGRRPLEHYIEIVQILNFKIRKIMMDALDGDLKTVGLTVEIDNIPSMTIAAINYYDGTFHGKLMVGPLVFI